MSRRRAARIQDAGIFGSECRGLADLSAWLALALATLAFLWPLGLTNRILAGVDAFTYFAPYWDYRMAALREGQVPLWNPYLFLGVPFLANPQAAVLYPLHWPLSWLTPEQALAWSALLHAWLMAGFTYLLARRSFGLTRRAAWLAGVIFGLGGFTLARVENINQLNALTWLPAMVWLYDETAHAHSWRAALRWGSALTVAIALCLLAGHTQSFFVNMVGLCLYAVLQVLQKPRLSQSLGPWILSHLLPLLAIIPAMLLTAAQLLPTLELNSLGLRTGGLPYRQAVSFSLRPHLLAQTFLPPLGGRLAEAFASEGYAEFVGYIGIVALALAGLAARQGWRQMLAAGLGAGRLPAGVGFVQAGSARLLAPLGLTVLGIFLALGAYNPVYYLLWQIVPGFDLFRAPVRWLALFTLGGAILAACGLDALCRRMDGGIGDQGSADPGSLWLHSRRGHPADHSAQMAPARAADTRHSSAVSTMTARERWAGRGLVVAVALIAVVLLMLLQQPPRLLALAGWAATAMAVAALFALSRRWPERARGGLIALALLELWLGSRALPFTEATAPQAAGLRNAPTALLAATADQPPAGRDRFLSLSDIRYDPGDLNGLRALHADRLPAGAVERLVRAAKQVEIIAPNVSLRFRLPAVDGYDGGVLPLGRFVDLQSLLLPSEQLIPDGRLREQLVQVPAGRLLDLTGVRFVITDKQRDLWVEDIYYDLEQSASILPGQTLALDLAGYPALSATALGVVIERPIPAADTTVSAEIEVTAIQGESMVLGLPAELVSTPDPPAPITLHFRRAVTPGRLLIRNTGRQTLVVRGLSLIDTRTGAHASVTVSPGGDFRRIHTGDVKVYERIGAPGRAWLVHGIQPVTDDAAALALLADPAFDPRATVVLTADRAPQLAAPVRPDEALTIVTFGAERLVLRARVSAPAVLVLADSFYPGWEATVDGQPAAILRANLLLRGVELVPGEHEVVLAYRPVGWRTGVVLSLGALVLLAAGLLITAFAPGHRGV